MKKVLVCILFLVVACLTFTGAAKADSLNFQLATGNSAISGFTGPFADINITISGGVADFTVTTLSNATNQYYLGAVGTFGFVSTVAGTIGNVVEDGTFDHADNGTGGNEDGFGTFNYQLTNFDGAKDSLSSLTFNFTANSGSFTNVSDFLGMNADGNSLAGHVFVCSAGQSQASCADSTALATGFATNGGPVSSPEPASLALLGLGLLGAPFLRRLRK